MKFTGSIIINKPRALVAELFADPQHLHHYQDGFKRKELVSGDAGTNGAISMMYYEMGKSEMELKETITNNALPERFEAFYEHKHMDNTMLATFESIDSNSTRFNYEFDYVRISWIMPRLMFTLFPGMFRKQGEKWMNQFKDFVEQY